MNNNTNSDLHKYNKGDNSKNVIDISVTSSKNVIINNKTNT